MGEDMWDNLSKSQKQEYATKLTMISLFLSTFAWFVARLSIRQKNNEQFEIKPFDLLLLGFATLRLGRMVSYDRVAEPLRQPFTTTIPDPTGAGETVEPRGSGFQRSLGQLLCCPICVGTWIAAGLVYGLHTLPKATRMFISILGTIGFAEVLNAITEALSWSGQLARTMAGAQLDKRNSDPKAETINNLFTAGGNYFVEHDHEKHYRESGR